MKRYVVTLSRDEREALGSLVSVGEHRSRKILKCAGFIAVMR